MSAVTAITLALGLSVFAMFVAVAVLGHSPNERRAAKKGGCQ